MCASRYLTLSVAVVGIQRARYSLQYDSIFFSAPQYILYTLVRSLHYSIHLVHYCSFLGTVRPLQSLHHDYSVSMCWAIYYMRHSSLCNLPHSHLQLYTTIYHIYFVRISCADFLVFTVLTPSLTYSSSNISHSTRDHTNITFRCISRAFYVTRILFDQFFLMIM